MLLIVRFVSDWSLYAAGDEAAFEETLAMGLQQKGIALVQRPVDDKAQMHLPIAQQMAGTPGAGDDKKRGKSAL